MAGAPGMPESLSHLREGPLPSIDERDELFMPEKLPHPASASSHPAPSSSRCVLPRLVIVHVKTVFLCQYLWHGVAY